MTIKQILYYNYLHMNICICVCTYMKGGHGITVGSNLFVTD